MNPPHNHEPQSAGVMITRQLLDHRVLPAAISYIARFTPDMATWWRNRLKWLRRAPSVEM